MPDAAPNGPGTSSPGANTPRGTSSSSSHSANQLGRPTTEHENTGTTHGCSVTSHNDTPAAATTGTPAAAASSNAAPTATRCDRGADRATALTNTTPTSAATIDRTADATSPTPRPTPHTRTGDSGTIPNPADPDTPANTGASANDAANPTDTGCDPPHRRINRVNRTRSTHGDLLTR
ncbi:hypothetical protein [Actinokineospora pegani]|uniref:hypothetical protein n=1 Tax=Actinokineospora pegani TaxID=2654637 RepID=UPI0012E99BFA|nr:hypothetical protein [Actinokineospora pegani]